MVKLIRLQSDIDTLNFNSVLNDNLILNPKSRIGLQSIAWEKDKIEIRIIPGNRTFIFGIEDSNYGDVELDAETTLHREYTFRNVDEYIADIEDAFNNCLRHDVPKCIGLIIRADESKSKPNHLEISSTQRAAIDFYRPIGDTTTNFRNVSVDAANNVYSKNNAAAGGYSAALFGTEDAEFFQSDRGCGIFRFRLNELGVAGAGCYVGLSTTDPVNMGGDFSCTIAKLTFAIEATNQGSFYNIVKRDATTGNITKTATTHAPNIVGLGDPTNDVIEISVTEGNVEGRLYTHDGNQYNDHILFSEVYDSTLPEIFPIIGFDALDAKIANLEYTPYYAQDATHLTAEYIPLVGTTPQNRDLVNFSITFPSDQIRRFLGFDKLTETVSDTANFIIESDVPIARYDDAENYLVLLDNLNLDSFDYSKNKQKRRNILQLIPNIRNKEEKDVLYFTDNPVMIDIKNNSKITLNNLQMRVLDSEDTEVNISGYCEAVLLVENAKE
mgnify:CR=1 FL=1